MNIHAQDNNSEPTCFGNLKVQKRRSIEVFDAETGLCTTEYYHQDLNEVCKRVRNQYFIDKKRVIIRDDEGYVEHIGGELPCIKQ